MLEAAPNFAFGEEATSFTPVSAASSTAKHPKPENAVCERSGPGVLQPVKYLSAAAREAHGRR
jgi:hypothetical protein